MSEVTLHIAGRSYKVACAPGEEAQVERLGKVIDGKLAALGGNLSPSPAQNLLFASLLLADELDEARKDQSASAKQEGPAATPAAASDDETRLELFAMKAERDALAKELARLKDRPAPPPSASALPSAPVPAQDDTAELLEDLADALEKHAETLEAAATAS